MPRRSPAQPWCHRPQARACHNLRRRRMYRRRRARLRPRSRDEGARAAEGCGAPRVRAALPGVASCRGPEACGLAMVPGRPSAGEDVERALAGLLVLFDLLVEVLDRAI